MIITIATTTTLFSQYYWDDQTKEDDIGGECSMHGKYKKYVNHLNHKPEGKCLCRTWDDNAEREHLAQTWAQ
jgi:hypothetical protein